MNKNWSIVNFTVRWILGLLFLMDGYWQVFVLTTAAHAQTVQSAVSSRNLLPGSSPLIDPSDPFADVAQPPR